MYVDGFNLYYRSLRDHPQFKWLNPKALAEEILDSSNEVLKVKYYTARVSGVVDPSAPARQQIYLDALSSISEIEIVFGSFLTNQKYAPIIHPP